MLPEACRQRNVCADRCCAERGHAAKVSAMWSLCLRTKKVAMRLARADSRIGGNESDCTIEANATVVRFVTRQLIASRHRGPELLVDRPPANGA